MKTTPRPRVRCEALDANTIRPGDLLWVDEPYLRRVLEVSPDARRVRTREGWCDVLARKVTGVRLRVIAGGKK